MNIKVHFLITAIALVFLGVSISSPDVYQELQSDERMCKLIKGKMDCVTTNTDYEINQAEVTYSLN